MRVVVYYEKKKKNYRERVSYKFINSYESIEDVYHSNKNTYT